LHNFGAIQDLADCLDSWQVQVEPLSGDYGGSLNLITARLELKVFLAALHKTKIVFSKYPP